MFGIHSHLRPKYKAYSFPRTVFLIKLAGCRMRPIARQIKAGHLSATSLLSVEATWWAEWSWNAYFQNGTARPGDMWCKSSCWEQTTQERTLPNWVKVCHEGRGQINLLNGEPVEKLITLLPQHLPRVLAALSNETETQTLSSSSVL